MNLNLKLEYYPKVKNEQLREYFTDIKKNMKKWDPPFFTDTKSYLNMEKIKLATGKIMNDNLENIIILGTGGSIQTFLALKHLAHKKIFPIPSSRAVELKGCLEKTTPENSIVIPISRGGKTLDVNSTIGIFLKRGYKFLGISSKGPMNEMLKEINCPILEVPDLSGRFAGSISNVGIVPAFVSGVKVDAFLKGLEEGYKLFMNNNLNPSIELASFLFNLYQKGYKVVFSMPYSKNIEESVGLFVQEISESTGKDDKGLMGAYQSAPLCQHSVLEYLLGGSKGAVIPILWIVEKEIPDLILDSSIDYVNTETAQTIVNYQADSTFQALIEQSVPSAKITINDPEAANIGYLISFIQSTIYYLCMLLDVNWANNPKVVIGKNICNEALKNKILPEQRAKIIKKIANEKFKNFYN
ncbi:MAG: hypothetical protein HWN67_16025 [Candidatus Helarchaeota archaeon]|nr:hypothetical protein [Candidatus Helarchaeota archaeon]